jgi:hypothetical protein
MRSSASLAIGDPMAECTSKNLRLTGPGRFKVIRHVREKLSCRACDTVVAAAAPDHAITRGRAGAGLLAHIVVSKYDDHLPLYRQAEIFAREGVELETSTLSGWVGATSAALARQYRCWRRARAKPRPADYGPMFAMSGPSTAIGRRRRCSSTRLIARASTRGLTSRTFAV